MPSKLDLLKFSRCWIAKYPNGDYVGTTLGHHFPATKFSEVNLWNSYEDAKTYCDYHRDPQRLNPAKFTIHEVSFHVSLAEEE